MVGGEVVRSITFLFILCLLVSCSKKKPEEVLEAIDVAQTLLSDSQCDKAIDVLPGVGIQSKDAIYLQVLSSAYACKASYSEITFIADDVSSISTTNSGLMSSLS